MLININEIKENEGRRNADTQKVKELAESIEQIGLINPITVAKENDGYILVAGLHRLKACKLLGKDKIEVSILVGTDLELELAEIDENLIRNELHYTELDDLVLRKKQIYEKMYPETKVGGDRKSKNFKTKLFRSEKPSFSKDTSIKTGQSERNIELSTQRAESIIAEAKPILKEKEITKTEATILARQEPEQQKKIINVLKNGKASNVKEAQVEVKKEEKKQELEEKGTPYKEYKKPHVTNNSGNNEWYTPIKYIEIARNVMGNIDTDPATSEVANKVVKADVIYTQEDNGLEKDWNGNVWLNPPYAQPLIQNFADKLISEIDKGNTKQAMVLVNNATETKWFNTLSEKARAIWFMRGRVKFIDENGNATGAPLQGQAILYFGNNVETFINNCDGLVCRCQYE